MRSMIIGRGHLGTYLQRRFGLTEPFHYTGDLDALSVESLRRLQPDLIVNTAGKTELRWCEEHASECFRCNVQAPLQLFRRIKEALPPQTLYVHLSSGCIWDGPYRADGKPFQPYDPPQPACFYSWSKAAFDALLLQELDRHGVIILRPRQVYSDLPAARNTLAKLRTYPKLIDTPNSMTSAETIARTIECCAAQPELVRGRILNVYDRGITSPYEVGTFLAHAGLRESPQLFTKDELDQVLIPKRVDAVIEDTYFESLVRPPRVQDELKRVIERYRQNSV